MNKITTEQEYDIACIEFLRIIQTNGLSEAGSAILEMIKAYEIKTYPKHFRNVQRYHRASKLRNVMYLAKHRTRSVSYVD